MAHFTFLVGRLPPKHTVRLYLDRCIPLLVQQNVDGHTPFFNRSWAEFKVGFNDSKGNYWLGNELLHQLTSSAGRYKLRFDLQARANLSWYYAEYSWFQVESEQTNYTLRAGGYRGNAVTKRRIWGPTPYDCVRF